MLTAEKKKKYTASDYLLLEEGSPFQLINFDLVMSPSPNPLHQALSLRITQAFANFLDEINDTGYLASAPMDVKFDNGNILQPDVLYISGERKSALITDKIEGAPDLVIEILSPTNAYYDLRQKKDLYEKYGVKEYIIFDPVQENADIYVLKDGVYHLHQKVQKTGLLKSVLINGFTLDLKKIFR